MDIKTILGANITRYRKRLKISQDLLSERLDISPKHLSNIESGKKFVSSDLLEKIIVELKVAPSALFYDPESKGLDESTNGHIDIIIDEQVLILKQKIRDLK